MIIHTRIEGSQLSGNLLEDPTERDLFARTAGLRGVGPPISDRLPAPCVRSSAEQLVTPATDGQRWSPPLEDVLDPVFGRRCAADDRPHPRRLVALGVRPVGDSPVTGRFEQYVLHDVIPQVDAAYRRFRLREAAVYSVSRREDSAPGTSPRATPTSSAPWRCSRPTRSWT